MAKNKTSFEVKSSKKLKKKESFKVKSSKKFKKKESFKVKSSKKLKKKESTKKNLIPSNHRTLQEKEKNLHENAGEVNNEDDDAHSEYGIDNLTMSTHKKDLEKLKNTDPDFYKFLQQNDRSLLDFDLGSSDSEDEEDDDKVHRPPNQLEVDSEEEDYEGDDKDTLTKGPGQQVTLKMVQSWEQSLQNDQNITVIRSVIEGFHAALQNISKDENESVKYKVTGSAVFNAVVQLCVLELQPAITKYLKLPTNKRKYSKLQIEKARHWRKIKFTLKQYFIDLLKLLGGVTSEHILCVMLKHLHQMISYLVFYKELMKRTLERLVTIWSQSEDTVRVLAFLCILRLTTSEQQKLLDPVLKRMYLAYITNSKFVSPSTLPGINFMRRSLTEMLLLDPAVTYQHAFLYIRQLALHLRNGITLKKQVNIQTVCNWQYMSSLNLWTDVICAAKHTPQLQSLLYPLVQVIFGCIKLVPTTKYLPLRFHCCRMLINITKETGTFIPVLPIILEVLSSDFNTKVKKVSMKPLDFTCILKLTDSQMLESAFKDTVIEQVNMLTIESLAAESHRLSFPDLTLLPILHIKTFLKTCKVAKHSTLLQSSLKKIEENVTFINSARKKLTLSLSDEKGINSWERNIQMKGTPLGTFCASLKKIHTATSLKRITQNDKLADFKLPMLKKGTKRRNREELEPEVKAVKSDEDHDDDSDEDHDDDSDEDHDDNSDEDHDDDSDEDKTSLLRRNDGDVEPKKKKKKTDEIVDEGDIVEDFSFSDVD